MLSQKFQKLRLIGNSAGKVFYVIPEGVQMQLFQAFCDSARLRSNRFDSTGLSVPFFRKARLERGALTERLWRRGKAKNAFFCKNCLGNSPLNDPTSLKETNSLIGLNSATITNEFGFPCSKVIFCSRDRFSQLCQRLHESLQLITRMRPSHTQSQATFTFRDGWGPNRRHEETGLH